MHSGVCFACQRLTQHESLLQGRLLLAVLHSQHAGGLLLLAQSNSYTG